MEADQPKKKKKYVLANSVVNQNRNNNPQPTNLLGERKEEKRAEQRSRFDYSFEEIVNHLLARLLPDSNFTIKLSEKLIFGEEKVLDAFVAKLDENIKYTAGVVLELKEGICKDDIDYKMSQQYKGKTFNHRLIEMSVRNFFQGTKYERQYNAFLNQFKLPERNRLYVRLNQSYLQQFLQAIENEASLVQPEQQEAIDKPHRGNRTRFKKVIDSVQIKAQNANVEGIKKFFSRSDKIDRQDIEIEEVKSQVDQVIAYRVSLKCFQDEKEQKMQGFNYYFRHQNFILLPLKESKHKEEIIKEYENVDRPNIKIRLIKGYKSSKWDQKSLLYKIRIGQVSARKSNYLNEYFEAFHLIGVLPVVKLFIEQLQHKINEVPLDDIREQVFVQFEESVKDYIRSSKKIEGYIQKFILSYMGQFGGICDVEKVRFPLRGVKLNLKIRSSQEQNFYKIQNNIERIMPKYIVQQKVKVEYPIDQQFLLKLEEQGIMMVDHREKEFDYLTSTDDIVEFNSKVQKIIREFEVLAEQSIEVVGLTKKVKYLELMQGIKKGGEDYRQIFIPEPLSEDKVRFKIVFYGPKKKNDKFYQEVKSTIDKMEESLGEYSHSIEEQISLCIVGDPTIQQQIESSYNISLILGSTFCVDARLEVHRKKMSQILVVKTKELTRVPLGAAIYFSNKEVLNNLKQKYLQKFKLIVKRFQQPKWLQDYEKSRNYKLWFKLNFTVDDLLQQLQKSDVSDESKVIALFMPQNDKQKWLRELLQMLAENLNAHIAMKVYLLQMNSEEDIQKVVNLPEYNQYMPKKEKIQTYWFCQNKPYSKGANSKINDAIANRINQIIFSKEEITNWKSTHICDLQKKTIVFVGGGVKGEEIPLLIQAGGASFKYKNYVFRFAQTDYNTLKYYQSIGEFKFHLSMPFYRIDVVNNLQTNIWTNKARRMDKRQVKVDMKSGYEDKVRVFYKQKSNELIYSFQESNAKSLIGSVLKMSEYIESLWKKKTIDIKQIPQGKFKDSLKERILARVQQYALRYKLDPSLKYIEVQSCDEKMIQRYKMVIENEVQYLITLSNKARAEKIPDLKYPQYWQPQKDQIEQFEVKSNSKQFVQVQAQFTTAKIVGLFRIQNKIIYKKYYDELLHLDHMNGTMPKQMKLFHGTGKSSPDVIWMDKDDGFNINYSSDNNLLGRGVYFAQKSQYSRHYGFKQIGPNGSISLTMLLCSVIVGESQLMKMSPENRDVRGTNFKPMGGIRYESMLGKHDISDIYVVYKNRRAYPLYLIKYV